MTTIHDWQRRGERFLFAGHEIFCRDSYVKSGDEHAPALLLKQPPGIGDRDESLCA